MKKKIYLLLLIFSVVLLFPLTVKAANITVGDSGSDYNNLSAAINAAAAGDTITLQSDTGLNALQYITKPTTIDLNNHTITLTTADGFHVNGGNLTLTGTGTIYGNVGNSVPIRVSGSSNSLDANYSILNVGPNVTVKSNYGAVALTYVVLAGNPMGLPATNNYFYGIVVNFAGTATGGSISMSVNGLIKNSSANYPIMNIAGTAKITSDDVPVYAAGYADWTFADGVTVTRW